MRSHTELFNNLKEDFCKAYTYYKHSDYVWSAKDNTHLGLLMGKINKWKKTKLSSEEMRKVYRELLIKAFTIAPAFIIRTVSPAVIDAQFNAIKDAQENVDKYKKDTSGYRYNEHKREMENKNKEKEIQVREFKDGKPVKQEQKFKSITEYIKEIKIATSNK